MNALKNIKKRGRPKKKVSSFETDCYLDYETITLSKQQTELMKKGELSVNDVNSYPYSVQLAMVISYTEEEKDEIEAKYLVNGNHFAVRMSDANDKHRLAIGYIFLDERFKLAQTSNQIQYNVIPTKPQCCVRDAIEFALSLQPVKKSHKKGGIAQRTVRFHTFNNSFEVSHSLKTLFKIGFKSGDVIETGMNNILLANFIRENAEYKDKIALVDETAKHAARTTLSKFLSMYGLGSKSPTPLFADNNFLITPSFLKYALKDVLDFAIAVEKHNKAMDMRGKLTTSSETKMLHKEWFIDKYRYDVKGNDLGKTHGEQLYNQIFAPMSFNDDQEIRRHTQGGLNYVNEAPHIKNVYQYPYEEGGNYVRFFGIDRTNAYLSCMVFHNYPVGKAIKGKGIYKYDPDFPFAFNIIQIKSLQLKKGHMPSLAVKYGMETTLLVSLDDDARPIIQNDEIKLDEVKGRFYLIQEEMDMMMENYHVEFSYIGYWKFKSMTGEYLFGDYLKDRFYERKRLKEEIKKLKADMSYILSTNSHADVSKIKNDISYKEVQANTLKLQGNGLFGKWFENPDKCMMYYEEDEDEGFKLKKGRSDFDDTKNAPSQIGACIMRYQRLALIDACNKVMKAGATVFQCDTDAFLVGIPPELYYKDSQELTPEKLSEIAGIEYGDDLGKWHLEKNAVEGITVEKKVYAWSEHSLKGFRDKPYEQITGKKGNKDEIPIDIMFNKDVYLLQDNYSYIHQLEMADMILSDDYKDYYKNINSVKPLLKGVKIHAGTRGVRKGDALAQLSPNTWRAGIEVDTTQFKKSKDYGAIAVPFRKVLAVD